MLLAYLTEETKMTDKQSNDSRRKLLKSIAAGSGAVVAGKSLPESWTKPVVDSILLPAHAATTDCTTDTIIASSLDGLNDFARYVIIVDSSDNVIASCGDDGGIATASGLAAGNYRIFGDSDGPESHTITVKTSCSTATYTEKTTENLCKTIIATVSIPDGTITAGNGQVVTGPWECGDGDTNCTDG
jgi:hypothetical protein